MLGSGGVVVIDDQTCIVEFALRTISFYQHESCGWCIPCREGTDWLKKSLTRFHAGFGSASDIDNMQYLAENMLGPDLLPARRCSGHGPRLPFSRSSAKEFEDHLNGKPCPYARGRRPAIDGCVNKKGVNPWQRLSAKGLRGTPKNAATRIAELSDRPLSKKENRGYIALKDGDGSYSNVVTVGLDTDKASFHIPSS